MHTKNRYHYSLGENFTDFADLIWPLHINCFKVHWKTMFNEAKYANKADSNGNPTYLRESSCIYLDVNNDTTLFKIFHSTVYTLPLQ